MILLRILGLCLVGLGVCYFVETVLARSRGIKSDSWPVVEGIIVKTGIRKVEAYDDYANNWIHFSREIDYSYEFGGARYTSSRISFEEWIWSSSSRGEAEEWLSRYPEGTRVRVYCNPHKPQESVLAPGFRGKALIGGLFVRLVFLAIGVIPFVVSLNG